MTVSGPRQPEGRHHRPPEPMLLLSHAVRDLVDGQHRHPVLDGQLGQACANSVDRRGSHQRLALELPPEDGGDGVDDDQCDPGTAGENRVQPGSEQAL